MTSAQAFCNKNQLFECDWTIYEFPTSTNDYHNALFSQGDILLQRICKKIDSLFILSSKSKDLKNIFFKLHVETFQTNEFVAIWRWWPLVPRSVLWYHETNMKQVFNTLDAGFSIILTVLFQMGMISTR